MQLLQPIKLDKAEPSLQAPSEAESQCAQMCKDGVVRPAISCTRSGEAQVACMIPLISRPHAHMPYAQLPVHPGQPSSASLVPLTAYVPNFCASNSAQSSAGCHGASRV